MSERPLPQPGDIARQLTQHIDSLRAAGIEWVTGAPPQEQPPPPPRPALTRPVQPLPVVARPTAPEPVQTSLLAQVPIPVAMDDAARRLAALEALRQRVAGCTRCPHLASTRTQTVFGVGPLDPDLCFVGEAPGADEDRLGEPFVGPAGQLLTRIITACGMRRDEVFICNILRCRPPGNRTPTPEEANHCKEFLEQTIDLVRPRFLCALGGTAVTHLLGTTVGISRLRGRFLDYRGIPVLCTFHPSYLLRTPEKKKDVWEDMKTLLARMGRPVPGKSGG